MVYKIGALKNFAIFQGKRLFWNLFFNKVVGQNASNFIKKRPQHRSFPMNFAKFSRRPFFHRTRPVAAFANDQVRESYFNE